jgi:hypothetical protein
MQAKNIYLTEYQLVSILSALRDSLIGGDVSKLELIINLIELNEDMVSHYWVSHALPKLKTDFEFEKAAWEKDTGNTWE